MNASPRRPSSLLRGGLVLAALAASAAAFAHPSPADAQQAPAPTYAVRFQRRAVVGQRARVVVEGEKRQTMRVEVSGRPPVNRDERLRVQLRAVERITAVNAAGRQVGSELTIERFVSDDAGGEHVLLRPGQVLTVVRGERGAEPRVTVGGRPVERPVRDALAVVMSLSISETNDDDVFGTAQRQPVGASWPINSAVAQADLEREAHVTSRLTGQTRINALTTVQRQPCLDVTIEMSGTVTAMQNLPPRASVRSGTMRMTMRGMLPVSPTAVTPQQSMEMTVEMVVDLPPNAPGDHNQIQITVHETKSGTVTPLGR